MGGLQSATTASSWLTAPSTSFDKVDQGAIADNKRLGPILAMIRDEQLRRRPNVAVGRADAIGVTPVFSRLAELFYEPSELALAR
jgi:hypothetical protein